MKELTQGNTIREVGGTRDLNAGPLHPELRFWAVKPCCLPWKISGFGVGQEEVRFSGVLKITLVTSVALAPSSQD